MTFNPRGLPLSATAHIVASGGSPTISDGTLTWDSGASITTQEIIHELVYEADGQVTTTTYGDDVDNTHERTVSTTTYDARRRPTRMRTEREATEVAVSPARPLGAVTVPFDQSLDWDAVSNLTAITDNRDPLEWEPGHRPQSIAISHDGLYRVVNAAYTYRQDNGSWTSVDEGTDWRTEEARVRPNDPMRREAAPMLPAPPDDRVADLTWQYDWLGNMTLWEDDAHAFYERSIGTITNGADVNSALRPSALYLSSDLSGPSTDRGGYVELDYGSGGNVVGMTVRAQCRDLCEDPEDPGCAEPDDPPEGAPALEKGACEDPGGSNREWRRYGLSYGCVCESAQHYQYLWDESNRLSEARRYDRIGGAGSWLLQVRQRARYDSANERTVKHTIDLTPALGPPADPPDRIVIWPYTGDFERRGLTLGLSAYTANTTLDTEDQFIVAGARIVWQAGSSGTNLDSEHFITQSITDLLGTAAAVIDLRSGWLTEASTYYPNGGREILLASTALVPVEQFGFTTKEADDEVGLTYFGERYLVSRIGRWCSPDPLAVHAVGGGEAMNAYHYVSGNLLQVRDPQGLEGGNDDWYAEQEREGLERLEEGSGRGYGAGSCLASSSA